MRFLNHYQVLGVQFKGAVFEAPQRPKTDSRKNRTKLLIDSPDPGCTNVLRTSLDSFIVKYSLVTRKRAITKLVLIVWVMSLVFIFGPNQIH